MNYGVIITGGDPRTVAELAAEAETAGWDGAFFWDGVALGAMDTFDPWVVLAAMAMRTERIRLGAIVFAPTRRRPWKLAREALSIDHLSNGRLLLPVGLGTPDDGAFGNVGEPTDLRTRAELLDETLAILDGLWSGEPFAFQGKHYRFGPMTFRPKPVQEPRISDLGHRRVAEPEVDGASRGVGWRRAAGPRRCRQGDRDRPGPRPADPRVRARAARSGGQGRAVGRHRRRAVAAW